MKSARWLFALLFAVVFVCAVDAGEKKKHHRLHNLFHKKNTPAKVEPTNPATPPAVKPGTPTTPPKAISITVCPNCRK